MSVLAASYDTWGIPGPLFLRLYLLTAVLLIAGTLVHRVRVLAGPGQVGTLGPQQAAYLVGGSRQAVWAALGGLRGSGAVGVRPDRRLATSGHPPAGLTPLDRAVHQAASRHVTTRELPGDAGVRAALDQLRTGLEQRGLLLSAEGRTAARVGALLLTALLALGVVRVLAGLANERPVGFLVLSLVPLLVVTIVLHRVPRHTRAARRALRDLRRQYHYLRPAATPAYATYGAAGAAMGVALFGTATLWAMDPGFAEQAEIQRQALGTGGGPTTSCGGGSSSCGGGGSSCGGGGGGCGG